MDALFWIDNRTLLVCQCVVIGVFSIMLAGMRSLNPNLRGIGSIACGFFLGLPAAILLTAIDHVPVALSQLGGGTLALASSVFLFRGIVEFCEEHRPRTTHARLDAGRVSGVTPAKLFPAVLAVSLAGVCSLAYYSLIEVRAVPCLIVMTAILAFNRGLMAWALFRCSGGRSQMVAFSISMGVFAGLTAFHALATLANPGAANLLGQHSSHTLPMLAGVIFFCIQGVFYLLMFAGDITDSLHAEAHHDHLSGTLNRRGIEDALRGELARTRRTGGTFAVMLIDIDHFKQVNDHFGHAAGDESLRRVASAIGETIRVYDSLGRYGGDEFLLLMPEIGADDAMHTAMRIRAAVHAEQVDGMSAGLTLSIGLTCCEEPEEMLELVSRADAALYEAKRAGRDCARMRLVGAEVSGMEVMPELQLEGAVPGLHEAQDPGASHESQRTSFVSLPQRAGTV